MIHSKFKNKNTIYTFFSSFKFSSLESFSIRIRRTFDVVSDILRYLFFFTNIFTFFQKHLRITVLPILKTKLIKLTDKDVHQEPSFGM